jgi:hypothetical protein
MNLEIIELIKQKRPNITPSSVRTYRSLLKTLYDTVCGDKSNVNFNDFLKREKEILQTVKTYPLARAKTCLSALFIVSGNEVFKRDMIKMCETDTEQLEKQEATDKQKDNWVSQSEIREKWTNLYTLAEPMLDGKTNPDFVFLNAFMLFSLMSGVFIPPRRVSDYCNMFIRGKFNKETDNWYNPKTGVMNIAHYKTVKYYGVYQVNLKEKAPELFLLLKKWCNLNKTDFLFFNKIGQSISPSSIVHYNEKIWNGKNVSANIYRHSYLTHFYSKGMPSLVDMQELGKAMGHDVLTALKYIKRDV